MKRKFSFILALVASVLLITTSCSNASNITVVDKTKGGKFNEDGMAVVTVKLGNVSARTILPEQWDEGRKQKLFYTLVCTDSNGTEAEVTMDYTYDQLKGNNTKLALAPIDTWKMVLTAFQGTKENEIKKDPNKPVLAATIASGNLKLSEGSKDAVFNLVSTKDERAQGDVDIEVNFTQEADAMIDTILFDIVDPKNKNLSIISDKYKDKKTVSIATEAGQPVKQSFSVAYLAETASSTDPGVSAGDYMFIATFKGDNKIRSQYISSIRIDGGNISKAVIDIPENTFNRAPTKPTDLKAECYFAPVGGNQMTIASSNKNYAQDIDSAPVANENRYRVKFTWTDTSFNENAFKLKFNLDGEVDPQWVTYDGADISKSTGNFEVPTNIEGGTSNNGNMNADSSSITIEIPTGKFISNVTLAAVNTFGETDSEPLVLTQDKLGMYTVTYNLEIKPGVKGLVNANGVDTKTNNFVQAFEYSNVPADNLISKEKGNIYVYSPNYTFGGWYVSKPDTLITNVSGFKNADSTVKGLWKSEATIKINYPDYIDYKELKTVTDQNEAKKIVTENGKKQDITFTLPKPTAEEAEISNINVIVLPPNGGLDQKLDIDDTGIFTKTNFDQPVNGASLTWKITDYINKTPKYGIYNISISYNYKKAGSLDAIPVSGNFYVDIVNGGTSVQP